VLACSAWRVAVVASGSPKRAHFLRWPTAGYAETVDGVPVPIAGAGLLGLVAGSAYCTASAAALFLDGADRAAAPWANALC
jgi:hypothetical protein